MRFFHLAPLILVVASVARAQHSDEFDRCMERARGNTVQQGVCAQAELGREDARLNKAYGQLMTQYKTDATRRLALRDEERSWLKRRDYDCKLDGNTVDNTCLVRKTTERADELESKLKF